MSKTDIEQVRECPFCGSTDISEGEVLTEKPNGKFTTQSMCRGCGALGPEAEVDGPDYGSKHANEAWNRRTDRLEASQVNDESVAWQAKCEVKGSDMWLTIPNDVYENLKKSKSPVWEIRPLYTQPKPADAVVPDGWQLVPIEPTAQMTLQGTLIEDKYWPTEEWSESCAKDLYRAMLSAAPQQPQGVKL